MRPEDAQRFVMANARSDLPGPWLAGVSLSFTLLPAVALAQPEARTHDKARIVYSAPPACPDENAFLGRVRAKTQRDWLASPGEFARTINVTLRARGAQSVASVVLVDPEGRVVSRELVAETCEAAANAIAVVTAIAIESQTLPDVEIPAPEGPGAIEGADQAVPQNGA